MRTNLHTHRRPPRRAPKASQSATAPNYALRYLTPDYVYILDHQWIGNDPECAEDLIREIETQFSLKGGWQ